MCVRVHRRVCACMRACVRVHGCVCVSVVFSLVIIMQILILYRKVLLFSIVMPTNNTLMVESHTHTHRCTYTHVMECVRLESFKWISGGGDPSLIGPPQGFSNDFPLSLPGSYAFVVFLESSGWFRFSAMDVCDALRGSALPKEGIPQKRNRVSDFRFTFMSCGGKEQHAGLRERDIERERERGWKDQPEQRVEPSCSEVEP